MTRHNIGEAGTLARDIKALCCDHIIRAGGEIVIRKRTTDQPGKARVVWISEEAMRAEKPDYLLVLPWHFIHEFVYREQEFLRSGGQFIVPLPEVSMIGA